MSFPDTHNLTPVASLSYSKIQDFTNSFISYIVEILKSED